MVFDKELFRLWLEKENSEREKTNLDVSTDGYTQGKKDQKT